MPDPVIEAANTYRAQLLRQERAAAVRMVREYGRIYAGLQSQIDALLLEIAAMPEASPAKVARLTRFRALASQIESEMARFGAWADTELTAQAQQAIVSGLTHAEQLTLAGMPEALRPAVSAIWNRLPAEAVEMLTGFLSPGSALHDSLVNQLGPTVAQGVSDALLEGLALGYNPRKVAAIIRDTLGQALTWALRTARTSMLWAYRESTRAGYVANSDIVTGWIWHAELGPRTCMACIAQHGTLHPLSETLNDHHNGRCAMLPVTRTWASMGFTGIEERPPVQTGRDWFASLSPAQQASYMPSTAMWNAWQQGAVGWDDLVSYHDNEVYGAMLQLPSLKAILGEDAVKYYVRK